jgi:hypothetical protein
VSLGEKWEPISKTTRKKRARGMAQVVKGLPSKYEALSSNPIVYIILLQNINCFLLNYLPTILYL